MARGPAVLVRLLGIIVAVALLTSAVSIGTAAAGGSRYELLPTRDARPADRAVLSPRQESAEFRLRSTPGDGVASLDVRIATRNVLNRDGLLAGDVQVWQVRLQESDVVPGLYRSLVRNGIGALLSAPGTYYWQARTLGLGTSLRLYRSRVYRFTVGRGQRGRVPQLTRRQAERAAVGAIFRGGRRRGVARTSRISASCARPSFDAALGPFQYYCTGRWRQAGRSVRAPLIVAWHYGRIVVTRRFG